MWEFDDDDLSSFEGDEIEQGSGSRAYALIVWFVNLLALLQRKHYIPDGAINLLLKLLWIFINLLSKLYPDLSEIVQIFPSSFYQMQRFLRVKMANFVRYTSCPHCHKIYQYDECIEECGSSRTSKLCSYCNRLLLKSVVVKTGRIILHPFKAYCYKPLCESLETLLGRPSFYVDCEKWRGRNVQEGLLKDVYDGLIWKEFHTYDGEPFLSEPFTFGLMMNIDWFKVYKHSEYKVGAIYLTIINLPRALRFRQENVILIGLIPGPCEPDLTVNTYLAPLVDELLKLFDGVTMNVHSFSEPQKVRCALLCVACDMPASRKVVGFFSHSAKVGCSRCLKEFPGSAFEKNKDYSGFDRSKWPPRSNTQHRDCIKEISKCKQKTRRQQLESKFGCRYSELLRLPYFDPVRMTIIDPMHSLYLGTSKHVLKDMWLEQQLITKSDLNVIQKRVDAICVPHGIGRIPSKISSSFSGFTADQFKNWTDTYSLLSLYDILDKDNLELWRHFVLASRILTQMQITTTELQLADALLLRFCNRAQRMYGCEIITPNMHMHGHLKDCVLDYGPIHNFWCFSFERYNGILENYPTNTSVEVHLMNRFLREFFISSASLPAEYKENFDPVLASLDPVLQGSLRATLLDCEQLREPIQPEIMSDWTIDSNIILPLKYVRSAFDQDDMVQVDNLYSFVYSSMCSSQFMLNTVVSKYSKIEYYGTKYESRMSQPGKTNIVFVQQYSPAHPRRIRPVVVHYFVKHTFYYDNELYEHLLMRVSWLKEHHAINAHGKPTQIWWGDLFEPNFNYIPVQLIVCTCASIEIKYEEQTVLLLCPTQNIPL